MNFGIRAPRARAPLEQNSGDAIANGKKVNCLSAIVRHNLSIKTRFNLYLEHNRRKAQLYAQTTCSEQ